MLTINTNFAALRGQNALSDNISRLQENFQRLSTGFRVNSAKDDAAGFAIATKLDSSIRGARQGLRNLNDGISLVQTAENALDEASNIVQRLRELAVQSSNGTLTVQDRSAIDSERDQLISTLADFATNTSFNGTKLLDGTFSAKGIQYGSTAAETVSVTIRTAAATTLGTAAVSTGTVVTTNPLASGDVVLNGTTVGATSTDGVSTVDPTASALAKVNAINAVAGSSGVRAEVVATSFNAGAVSAATVTTTTNTIQINGQTLNATVLANDSDGALRSAINSVSSLTGVSASLNSSDELILTASDGRNIASTGTGTGAATAANITTAATTTTGQVKLLSLATIELAAASANEAYIGFTADVSLGTTSVNDIDLTTQSGASSALETLDFAVEYLNREKAVLGAYLNQFDALASFNAGYIENLEASKSRIIDTDFAAETAAFSRNQILQQASASVLAQANVSSQIALQLLG